MQELRIGWVLPLAIALVACHGKAGTEEMPRSAAPTNTAAPRGANGVPAITDGYFAEPAMFRGECFETPQGGGGCWSLTLLPDGVAEHMYVDVLVRERYEIDGDAVILRTKKGIERLETKDGFSSLGEYRFVPP